MKSKACTAHACEDCDSPAKCWHGKTFGKWDYIYLNVPLGSKFTHFVAEVWARCGISTNAKWWVEHLRDWRRNGQLEIHVGNTNVATLSTSSGDEWTELPITGEDQARIRMLWYPDDPDRRSYARVWIEAVRVDSSTDVCMGVKNCLDLLGDGSEVAFRLRNDNGVQWRYVSECRFASTLICFI